MTDALNRAYDNLRGKKLLVLGCTRDDCLIVRSAQEMGVYTIVTDNHLDWIDAPAKYIADEAWDISWSEMESLVPRCLEAGVDGVMAGFSEFRVACAIRLSKLLGTRFYAEDESVLEKTFDKGAFKEVCHAAGVPVTLDFDYLDCLSGNSCYPVIVKPADNAGSRGIRACKSPEELRTAVEYASTFSGSGKVIIEELIEGAREVVIYYTIADGRVVLSAMCDKYERDSGSGFGSLPDAYLYPSRHLEAFVNQHDAAVRRAIEMMGIQNGSVNLQGFVKPDGSFVFFEMDYRAGGTCTFLFTEHFNQVSYLKMLVSYSLTGNMHSELLDREDPRLGGGCGLILTLLCGDGTIASQSGDAMVRSYPGVIYECFYHHIGSEIEVNGSQFPKAYRSFIARNTLEEAIDTARMIQDTIRIEDSDGRSLLFDRFDLKSLEEG